MWPIIQAVILGVVEGLTEFLPISSTGHLIVTEHAIGYHDAAKLFTVVIQVGAITAVIWHYRQDIRQRLLGLLKWEVKAQNFWLNIVIATIPAGIAGLLLDKVSEKYALPSTVAVALIFGGIVLLWAEKRFVKTHRHETVELDSISSKQALGVGLAQVFSLVPGVSRSGATIVGGMLTGLNRVTAASFSFWLSMPILILASGYKLLKDKDQLATLPGGSLALVAGTLAAFVSALLVVNWLLEYISKHDFKLFAYYRIGFGTLLLILIALGLLSNSV